MHTMKTFVVSFVSKSKERRKEKLNTNQKSMVLFKYATPLAGCTKWRADWPWAFEQQYYDQSAVMGDTH